MVDPADWRHLVLTLSLAVPRLAAALSVMPLLGAQMLPGLVRNGVIVNFALFLLPVVESTVPREDVAPLLLMALVLKETFIGLAIGYAVAVSLWAIEAAGFFIDNQRGAAMASSLNPLSGEETSPLGILMLQVAAVLIFSTGLFSQLLVVIYTTYTMWPVWSFFPTLSADGPATVLAQLDGLMSAAVLLGAPVITAMMLSEMGLALVSRFAPQLQVFFLAMPVKSAVGVLVLILYMPFLLEGLIHHFSVFQTLTGLVGRL